MSSSSDWCASWACFTPQPTWVGNRKDQKKMTRCRLKVFVILLRKCCFHYKKCSIKLNFPHILVWGSCFMFHSASPSRRRPLLRHTTETTHTDIDRDTQQKDTHRNNTHRDNTHTEKYIEIHSRKIHAETHTHRDDTHRDAQQRKHTQRQHTQRHTGA